MVESAGDVEMFESWAEFLASGVVEQIRVRPMEPER
jgi:hypothetical protein